MWPFRRREQAPVPGSVPVPVFRADWKSVPAIQRAIGEHPLTAPGDVFAGELATRHDPSVVSRTLGHHVSADAPSGLVLAVGSTSTRSDGPSMTTRPRLQRRIASPVDAVEPEAGGSDMPPNANPEVHMQSYRRELPVAATAEPAVENLTGLARDVVPQPVGPGHRVALQRSVPPPSSPAPSETDPMTSIEFAAPSTPAKLTLGQSRRLGLGAPLRQVPATSVQRAPAGTPATEATSMPMPGLTYKSLQKIAATPESGPAPAAELTGARLTESEPAESHPQIQRSIQASPERLISREFSTPSPIERQEPELQLPIKRVAREQTVQRSAFETEPVQLTPSVLPAAATPTVDLNPTGTNAPPGTNVPTEAMPLAPSSPLIQRASTDSQIPPGQSDVVAQAEARTTTAGVAPVRQTHELRPVSIQRLSDPPVATPQSALIEEHLQPFAARSVARQTPGEPEPVGNNSLSHDSTSPTPPELGLARTTQPSAQRFTAPTPFAAPTRALSLAVQRQAAEPAPMRETFRPLPLAPVATLASIQRAQAATMTAIAESSAPFAFQAEAPWHPGARPAMNLQRAEEEPAIEAGATESSAAAGGAAASSGREHGAGHTSESEMDVLAGRLYERIRGRLKSELLVDRERAGLLTDLR